jgi:hypothetical protein
MASEGRNLTLEGPGTSMSGPGGGRPTDRWGRPPICTPQRWKEPICCDDLKHPARLDLLSQLMRVSNVSALRKEGTCLCR